MTIDVQNVDARTAERLTAGTHLAVVVADPITGRYTERRVVQIVSVRNRGGGEYTLSVRR